ncbi:hypothetical protein SAMN05216559_1688 [Halomicrobium zhouii]|uniref:DUF6199 domain-containing protein n=1 Tax=Halomicrobium zhouii TaxID=767519 RepID=A0A1I6KZN7_9EURY|nr:hypothetical protein [Halomicrobium zhouii]SFR96703.1 hypothetical protein SAMN05216559_1688 [Halomicrobium zhouii]
MSPKRFLRALVRPRDALGEWTPSITLAVVAVVSLCALNAASVAYAGDAIAGEVSGSVTVENPEKLPEWVCEDSETDMPTVNDDGCDAPATIQEPLRGAASSAVDAVVLKAALAPAAWVVLFASLFAVCSGSVGGRDGEVFAAFRDGLGIAAIAAVPGALRYLARPVAVQRALADWTHPGTLNEVGTAAVHALFPDGPLWAAVVVLSALWTGFVVFGGARAGFEMEVGLAAPLAAAAFLTTAASAALGNGGWTGTPGGIGLLLLGGGVVGLLAAYTYISISKEFELVGFSGSRQVEPQSWYVGLHRLVALCVVVVGFVFLDGLALA